MFTVELSAADIGLLDLLDDRERNRYRRYAGEADRARMMLGAALLRCAAGLLAGVEPGALTVDRTCSSCGGWHGRPAISGTDLDVSVSHSGSLVAVAVLAGGGRVGVDVERLNGRPLDEVVAWTITEASFKAGGGPGLAVQELPSPLPEHVLALATDRPNATIEVRDGLPLLSAT